MPYVRTLTSRLQVLARSAAGGPSLKGGRTVPAASVGHFLHVTPARNVKSIRRLGLLCSKARTAEPEIWLIRPSRLSWAIDHVKRRHGCDRVAVFSLQRRPKGARRRRRGVWTIRQDVRAVCVIGGAG